MNPLYAEIHGWMARPFIWGECDCCTVIADWVWKLHGADPIADVRGLYDDPLTCERATGFIRDPVAAIDRALASVGRFERADTPEAGDIAVIHPNDGTRHPTGALWLGKAWACKGERGATTYAPAAVQVLAIWEVDYAKSDLCRGVSGDHGANA